MDEPSDVLLDRTINAAVERLLAERPTPIVDDLGQVWLVDLHVITACHDLERMVDAAERSGENAGFLWALQVARICELERLAAGSLDLWCSELDSSLMLDYMQAEQVPVEFSHSFLRGFICGALNAWEIVKARILEAIAS